MVDRGMSDVSERRESLEKALVVVNNAGNLRLLEHELRDENAIWIASAPPREVAAVRAKPCAQLAAERRSSLGRDRRDSRFSLPGWSPHASARCPDWIGGKQPITHADLVREE